MTTFLNPSLYRSETPLTLKAMVDLCQDGQFTGLVRAEGKDSAHSLEVLIASGAVALIYEDKGDGKPVRVGAKDAMAHLNGSGGFPARSFKLPAYALQLYKLFVESAGAPETRQVPTEDVVSLIPEWQSLDSPSLVTFHWGEAVAFLYLPGAGSYARHSAFVSRSAVEQEIIPAIEMLGEPFCKINRYTPVMDTPAWREYHLYLSFTAMANALMARYEQFGGRPVINALGNQLGELFQGYGLNMSVVGAKIFDRHFFIDETQAPRAYKILLQAILAHMEAVLGAARVGSIVAALLTQVDPYVRQYVLSDNLVPSKWLPVGEK